MAENSKIEWTDHTFNPWVGCTKVSPACDNCYAEAWAKRSGQVEWGNHPRRVTSDSYWRQPIKWNRIAARDGVRRKVFCASLADVFDNQVDPQWRIDLFALINATPWLDWLLLTKRPQNIAKMVFACAEIENVRTNNSRTPIPGGGSCAGNGDRRDRPNLALEKVDWRSVAGRQATDAMQTHTRRHYPGEGGLSSVVDDGGRQDNEDVRSSTGLYGEEGADSSRTDNQPRGRDQIEQSSEQFGIGDARRTTPARADNSESATDRDAGRKAPEMHDNCGNSEGNKATSSGGSGDQISSGHVRNDTEFSLVHHDGEVVEASSLEVWLRAWLSGSPPNNVWIGCAVENQDEADRRIPHLLAVPAKIKFLSCEPLLGPLDLSCISLRPGYGGPLYAPLTGKWWGEDTGQRDTISWIIAGGESGPHARPMHPDWARSLRDQCAAVGVSFFMKQWGEWAPYDRGRIDSRSLNVPGSTDTPIQRFGKKLAGAMLDGREHKEFPA